MRRPDIPSMPFISVIIFLFFKSFIFERYTPVLYHPLIVQEKKAELLQAEVDENDQSCVHNEFMTSALKQVNVKRKKDIVVSLVVVFIALVAGVWVLTR